MSTGRSAHIHVCRSKYCLHITPRESEIAILVAKGMQNKEIAYRLGIRTQTVKNHLLTLCKRLKVDGRTELTAVLIRAGAI